jgi:hypothetical protein
MKKALSEFSQNVRSRNRTINIKVTFISWVVEFVTGTTFLLLTIFGNVQFRPYYSLFYMTSMGVAVPFTYVINRDVTKEKILIRGWHFGIRSIFKTDAQVTPSEKRNGIPLRNLIPEPEIPRGSGSKTVIEIPPTTLQTAEDSAEEIDPVTDNSNPQLELPTRIPTYSSKTIQPILLPIISGNTDRELKNTLAAPLKLLTRRKSMPNKTNPETTETS